MRPQFIVDVKTIPGSPGKNAGLFSETPREEKLLVLVSCSSEDSSTVVSALDLLKKRASFSVEVYTAGSLGSSPVRCGVPAIIPSDIHGVYLPADKLAAFTALVDGYERTVSAEDAKELSFGILKSLEEFVLSASISRLRRR